jgi:type II secretory pathway pseudopilin PulG
MDIHPPGSKIHTFKDYCIHLSMVVLGILIALGLEGWRENRVEHTLVRHSIAAMRAEVEANRKRVEQAIKYHSESRQVLLDLQQQIEAALQSNPRKNASGTATEETKERTLHVEIPTFNSGAWQAAVATQALAHMEYAQAELWSTTYAAQEQVRLIQNDWIGVYGRLGQLNHVSDKDSAENHERLRQQLALITEVMQRIAMTRTIWDTLLDRYDRTLNTLAIEK